MQKRYSKILIISANFVSSIKNFDLEPKSQVERKIRRAMRPLSQILLRAILFLLRLRFRRCISRYFTSFVVPFYLFTYLFSPHWTLNEQAKKSTNSSNLEDLDEVRRRFRILWKCRNFLLHALQGGGRRDLFFSHHFLFDCIINALRRITFDTRNKPAVMNPQ